MSFAVALVSVILFAVAFRAAGVAQVAQAAIGRTRRTVAVLADGAQSEDAKERAAREAAVALFGSLATITVRSMAALLPAAAVLVAAILLGATDEATLSETLLSPWLAVAGCAAFAAVYLIRR
jgi:hypothetical protein